MQYERHKKVQVGDDQVKAQSERNIHYKKPRRENPNLSDNQVLILREHIVSQMSSYFPIGGHSITKTKLKL